LLTNENNYIVHYIIWSKMSIKMAQIKMAQVKMAQVKMAKVKIAWVKWHG